jgi:PAS domain S-box-containing protein
MQLNQATLEWLNDLTTQGILTTDTELKICSWNRWLEVNSGRQSSELIGHNLLEVYPELVTRRLDGYYKSALQGQSSLLSQRLHGYLLPMRPSIGDYTFTNMQQSVRIGPLLKDDNILGTITIIDDVTDRVIREAELQEQITALEGLHETSRAILSLELPECLKRIVEKAAELVNAPSAMVILRHGNTLKVEARVTREKDSTEVNIDAPNTVTSFVIKTGQPLFISNIEVERELISIDPGQRSVISVPLIVNSFVIGALVIGSPRPNAFDKSDQAQVVRMATQAALAIHNASLFEKERKARSEAEAANRAKDQFLATVSHELRTPLTAMLGWTRLLRSGKLDEQGAERALETIERNAKAQAQLIEDILDVSRIITGKLVLDFRFIELIPVIESAIESVRPAAEAKRIRISTMLDSRIGPVQGDPNRLQQVIWNLLSNAIKFTPEEGQVDILLQSVDNHAQISVRDTGKGINPEFLPYVFDRFRQADSSAARMHGGLGLGLSIVRHLVELHGGTVTADSKGEEKGATFTITLPLAISQRMPNTVKEGEQDQTLASRNTSMVGELIPRLDGLRVLVVDDEPDTLEMLETILKQTGAIVSTSSNAVDALENLIRLRPDVLISDIGMPGEDGYSLIRKVRSLSLEQGGRTPAVALTAYARFEDRMRALSSGYQMHISKPPELAELAVVIANLAGRIGR